MERFGFVGLPNAGKSSLFNALAGGGADVAPYPYTTSESNVGVGKVPDGRLDKLAAMSKSKKVVPASVEFVDIGGLAEGASQGEGLGNSFLAGVRQVDALVYVLRAFEDDDVVGSTDPVEQLEILELELTFADLETVENQIGKKRKMARLDDSLAIEMAALEKAHALLSEGTPIYKSDLTDEERASLHDWFLLTNKRVMAVVNVGEDNLGDDPPADLAGIDTTVMSVKLEAEAAQLEGDDRVEMLEALGLGEGALPRFVQAAYQMLGLRTFLTTGEQESRAWTVRAGAKAPEAAGRIHTDLQRGFIRAEVIRWDELLEVGSWNKAKEVGKLRVEGKDYEVVDGDVLEIRFNV